MLWRLLRQRWVRTNEHRIVELRRRGVRIGHSCTIYTMQFSTEPYLIEIGDRQAALHPQHHLLAPHHAAQPDQVASQT